MTHRFSTVVRVLSDVLSANAVSSRDGLDTETGTESLLSHRRERERERARRRAREPEREYRSLLILSLSHCFHRGAPGRQRDVFGKRVLVPECAADFKVQFRRNDVHPQSDKL